jgi:tetratricopeptide (TPR) repeat protein
MTRRLWIAAGLAVALPWLAGCHGAGKETATITLSYVLAPQQELPEGLDAVAVLDSGAEPTGAAEEARAQKWSTIAADLIEHQIQQASTRLDSDLAVAKRRDTSKILAEQDLKAAGLVDTDTAVQAGKLLDVQGLIASKLTIHEEVKTGRAKTIDAGSLVAALSGKGSVQTKEVEEVSRNLTVQCSFSLMDAVTGEAIVQYATPPYSKHDEATASPFLGVDRSERDLDPVDDIIGELVTRATREFIGMFLPTRVSYTYEVESARTDNSADGVAALRAENYERAMDSLKAAVAEDPEDHRSLFALGVTCESMGDYDAALAYYQQASSIRGVDDEEMARYVAARKRLAEHKDRIRRPVS